jgi:hypothetical protein
MNIAKQLTHSLTTSLILATLSLSVPLSVFAQDAPEKDEAQTKDTAQIKDGNATKDDGLKKSKTKEFFKYLNPIPEKNYTNESQDRVIKKRKFKPIAYPGAKPILNAELGLFAIIPTEKTGDIALMDELAARPDVNGLSIMVPWQSIEKTEGECDFTAIDQALEVVKKHNKTLILRVTTCGLNDGIKSDTPDWVFQAGVKTLTYKDSEGKEHQAPIFWDGTYMAKWSNFISSLGEKYDNNKYIHSVGITGGGVLGSTLVVPDFAVFEDQDSETLAQEGAAGATGSKSAYGELCSILRKEHKMSERQLVEHWKYVGDLFPKAFKNVPLNFDINPPLLGRKGQDALDEITDYLVYRYGQRVYLTRQNIKNGKHGFDQYRVFLKFHPDTLTGYRLRPDFDLAEAAKLSHMAGEDGVSFCEVPPEVLKSEDAAVKTALNDIQSHLGYQIISKEAKIPNNAKVGEPLNASFTFLNLGATGAMMPSRHNDKDVPSSYKIQLELRNETGKVVFRSHHTPVIPTYDWVSDKPITWEKQLRMPEHMKPGKYSVYLSLLEPDSKKQIRFLNAIAQGDPKTELEAPLGSIEITN